MKVMFKGQCKCNARDGIKGKSQGWTQMKRLTLKGPGGGTWCPPLVIRSNYSIEIMINRLETQCKFIFACLGPKEKSQSVLYASV